MTQTEPALMLGAPEPVKTAAGRKRERQIIAAAVDHFSRKGYADTSVEDVARAVGLLKGSLYYYIRSKDDLLFRVLLDVQEDVAAIVEQVRSLHGYSPTRRLDSYIRHHVTYSSHNVGKMAVYYRERYRLSPGRRAVIRMRYEANRTFLAGLILEGQRSGEIASSFAAPLVAQSILDMVSICYSWYEPGGPSSADELADTVARFALDGVRVRAGVRGDE